MILELALFIGGLVLGALFSAYRLKGKKPIGQALRIMVGGGGGPNEPA